VSNKGAYTEFYDVGTNLHDAFPSLSVDAFIYKFRWNGQDLIVPRTRSAGNTPRPRGTDPVDDGVRTRS
jgi:hypothetical protein